MDSLHLCRDESAATFILISPRLMLVAHLKIPKRSVNKLEMPHKWDKTKCSWDWSVCELKPLRKRKWASNGQYFGKFRVLSSSLIGKNLINYTKITCPDPTVKQTCEKIPTPFQSFESQLCGFQTLLVPRPVSAMSWHKYTSAIGSQETSMSLVFWTSNYWIDSLKMLKLCDCSKSSALKIHLPECTIHFGMDGLGSSLIFKTGKLGSRSLSSFLPTYVTWGHPLSYWPKGPRWCTSWGASAR